MTRKRDAMPERPPAPLPDAFPAPPGGGPRPEVPPPPQNAQRSGGMTALVLAGLLAVGVTMGFVVAMFLERGPCHEAAFVSTSFGYCVEPPEGWDATSAAQEIDADVFRNADGRMLVRVRAITHEGSLRNFAEQVRQDDSLAGFALGDPRSGSLDGSPTLEWEVRISSEGDEILMREIVVVREGVAWRVQIAEAEGAAPEGVEEAGRLVDSWRFA